jgi:hypothetical protein
MLGSVIRGRGRGGPGGRALIMPAALCLIVVLLGVAVLAESFTPGRGAWVAAGGSGTAGAVGQVITIGEPAAGIAAQDPAYMSAGFLAALAERLAIRLLPTAPAQLEAGTDLAIEADVLAETPADSMILHYRLSGRPDYAAVVMHPQPGGEWVASIPGDAVELRGVEYFLEVWSQGRVAYCPSQDYTGDPLQYAVRVTDSDGAGALTTTAGKSRMVSLPARLADGSIAAVLTDDLGEPADSWRCARWSPAAQVYREVGDEALEGFSPGAAFWLHTDATRAIDFTGETVFADGAAGCTIRLEPGWNMIANPYAYPIALADMRVVDGARTMPLSEAAVRMLLEAHPLHGYDGDQYSSASGTLAPWTGYFIANMGDAAIDLTIPPREAYQWERPQIPFGASPGTIAWALQLTAKQGSHEPATLRLGASAAAADGWDRWDQLVPPPAIEQPVLVRSVNPSMPALVQTMQSDVRPVIDPGVTWTVEVVAGEAGPVQLDWQLPEELPAGYGVRIVDVTHELWVDCAPSGTYATMAAEPGTLPFLVVVGTNAWLNEQSTQAASAGAHFATAILGGNPHRGNMQVRLVLQQPERVAFSAYDVNGRLVRTWGNEELAAGVHVLAWDGRTQQGEPAPTGVYFLRLTGANHDKTMRSVLVR